LTVEDFKHGDMVLYVPAQAKKNLSHPDCQEGIVLSITNYFVDVLYQTGHALTHPNALWKLCPDCGKYFQAYAAICMNCQEIANITGV
jgi:hypothetical protein